MLSPIYLAQAEKQLVAFNADNWHMITAAKVEKVEDRDALRIGSSNA